MGTSKTTRLHRWKMERLNAISVFIETNFRGSQGYLSQTVIALLACAMSAFPCRKAASIWSLIYTHLFPIPGGKCNENLHISHQLSTLTNFNYHPSVAVHTREANQDGTLGQHTCDRSILITFFKSAFNLYHFDRRKKLTEEVTFPASDKGGWRGIRCLKDTEPHPSIDRLALIAGKALLSL